MSGTVKSHVHTLRVSSTTGQGVCPWPHGPNSSGEWCEKLEGSHHRMMNSTTPGRGNLMCLNQGMKLHKSCYRVPRVALNPGRGTRDWRGPTSGKTKEYCQKVPCPREDTLDSSVSNDQMIRAQYHCPELEDHLCVYDQILLLVRNTRRSSSADAICAEWVGNNDCRLTKWAEASPILRRLYAAYRMEACRHTKVRLHPACCALKKQPPALSDEGL